MVCSCCLCDMTHSYGWYDALMCMTWLTRVWAWLTHMCDMAYSCVSMTHSYVWMAHWCMSLSSWFVWMAHWLTHMCDMTHSHVWHDSLICVAWLTHMCDVTHSLYGGSLRPLSLLSMLPVYLYVCHDSFVCVIWLICMWNLIHSYDWHDSLT